MGESKLKLAKREEMLLSCASVQTEAEGMAWLDRHLADSVAPLLDAPWILDTDTTIKPLYGRQQGAVIGYNPRKPGRPSHVYHTYLMAGLRQVLGLKFALATNTPPNTPSRVC